MSFLDRFKKGAGILCPRCEEPLEGHDEEKCARRMTRRHFVGVWGAAIAVAYGVGSDGKERVVLATESHLRAIEKELGPVGYMTSAKDGRVVRSTIGSKGHIKAYDHMGFPIQNTRAEEVLKLRGNGFHVAITSDPEKDKRNYWEAHNASLPATRLDDEFPSVYRW